MNFLNSKSHILNSADKNGSILMDVLVGFAIIALLATISIPYLKKYQPNLKLNSTARNLTSDLRYAQQLTVSEQVVHKVVFDLNNDNYQILRIGTSTTTVKTVAFEEEVNFQQITGLSNDQVVFNSYGGVSESGQVVLINTNNNTATINIKPSGYIELLL
ncbi:hypothetical protein HY798_01100 [Candidatus Falkowbacteria bacterium]|nr:hypothetical protein [Candidatus Falkowbacteria bacterium]